MDLHSVTENILNFDLISSSIMDEKALKMMVNLFIYFFIQLSKEKFKFIFCKLIFIRKKWVTKVEMD